MVVNTLVVLEIFYLFHIRYLHMTSLTWKGTLGTLGVWADVLAITASQLVSTYLPTMNEWFQSRPLGLQDGGLVMSAGVALLLCLEVKKLDTS